MTYLTDYNRPGTWRETADFIRSLEPDLVVFQWAIALQGLPMGRIARRLRQSTRAEIMFDVHVLVQKESSILDRFFTQYGLSAAHSYIAHAFTTAEELKAVFPETRFEVREDEQRAAAPAKTILKLYHPVYDLFKPRADFDVEAEKARLGLQPHVFLFFGFIRKYKGLHHVIDAFARLRQQRDDVSLLIVGESFWQTLDNKKLSTRIKNFLFGTAKRIFLRNSDDERDYNPLARIGELGLEDRVVVVNQFVPNEEVYRYFQVSDAILTYYLTATPSGVESLAYNFQMPVLATRVGHFPETIEDGYNGYLAEPEDVDSMAQTMLRFLEKPIPREHVAKAAAHMSWDRYAARVQGAGDRVQGTRNS
ncbi:MAG: glycosyltransferase [Bacteroidetes bacterium]|nr:MAG: glycosyltransferase [Bacteroidota bacterium]